ncbi:MAG: hypothetical protein V4708_15275 [Bacteroidota bacterium]
MRKALIILALVTFLLFDKRSYSQIHTFDVGLRFQKTQDLYFENGITAQYQLTKRWGLGSSYYTSRLGSAMGSNAIKQDNFIFSAAYFFRPDRILKPFIRANTGYFTADYESDIFEKLTHTSALVSADAGLVYHFNIPLKLNFSLGYNAITGSGDAGAGTLYPVFYQTSITWNMLKTRSK